MHMIILKTRYLGGFHACTLFPARRRSKSVQVQERLTSEMAGRIVDCLASLAGDEAADSKELGSLLGEDA